MNNIGIITWHDHNNFGGNLQAFALQQAVHDLKGDKVEIINYHTPHMVKASFIKNGIKLFLGYTFGRFIPKFNYGHLMFRYRYLHQGKMTMDANELPKFAEKYDVIVCGSDQIWAPNVYNPVYFASFAKPGVRKVSYAASIGLNDIPEDLVPKYKEHLKDFYAVSLREAEGKELLERKCGIEAEVVLDPTLLHDKVFYEKIQRPVNEVKGEYLLCYFLNIGHHYKDRVVDYANKHKLKVVGISRNNDDSQWMQMPKGIGADQFVWLVNHAEAVMTDSYHGTIFSLLFHKKVWTFQRFDDNDPICQNSRIRQLQTYFGLSGHILASTDKLDESISIDYNNFETALKPLREYSLNFLRKAIQ